MLNEAVLANGGRGISAAVEDALVNPLARQLITLAEHTTRVTVAAISQAGTLYTAVLA